MSEESEVRPATPDDLDEIASLWTHYIRAHRGNPAYRPRQDAVEQRRAVFEEHVRSDDSEIFVVARKGGGLDGMITCFVENNLPYFLPAQFGRIQTPYVRPDARKRGNLKRLVAQAFRWARSMELTELRLYTGADNVMANAIAEDLGFESVEVIRRRKLDWSTPPEEQVDE